MARIRIDLPHRGFANTFGGLIDAASGNVKQTGNWLVVEEREPGVFIVVDDNLTVKNGNWVHDATFLGFSHWRKSEVQNLDDKSAASTCGMSLHLRWKDVDLNLFSGNKFQAPSIERLREALSHVAICAYCRGDIID